MPRRRPSTTFANLMIACCCISVVGVGPTPAIAQANAVDDWVCVPSARQASGWECGRGANAPKPRDPLPAERPVTPKADSFLAGKRDQTAATPSPAPVTSAAASPAAAATGAADDPDAPATPALLTPHPQSDMPAAAAATDSSQTAADPAVQAAVIDDQSDVAETASLPAEDETSTPLQSLPTASLATTSSNARFTIQLANVDRESILGVFAARHGISGSQIRGVAVAYPEGARYLALWGSFDSWNQARAALAEIPGDGSIQGAWIRGLDDIDILSEVVILAAAPATTSPRATHTTLSLPPLENEPVYSEPVHSNPVISDNPPDLLAANPRWYTVQIASMRERASVERYIIQHGLEKLPVATTRIRRGGSDWFLLLYGAWPSLAEARTAIRGLPAGVQADGPWTRRLGPIQDQLSPAR